MPILRFENVTKQFDTDSYGVHEVSFAVEPGEFVFITGPSGSGKTTLMRLLLKEYPFNSGEIFFHDTTLSNLKDRQVHLHRRRIGVVFQDYKLIPEMNVWENIALPLWVTGKGQDEVERRVTDLLNLIKLPEKALHFPSQLSGGEAQRVGIARALAIGPEVVIADEPTGNLDPVTAQNVARLLKKINELGTTVLIATHDHNILATYPETRKITLEKGQLVKDSHGHSKLRIKITDTPAPDEAEAETKPETPAKATAARDKKKPDENQEKKAHRSHSEQHIAEDLIPAEADHVPPQPALPWWKKLLGGKKAVAQSSESETSTSEKPKPTETKSHSESEVDDLVTITEEALDDEGEIASESTDLAEKDSKKSEEAGHKSKLHDKKSSHAEKAKADPEEEGSSIKKSGAKKK